MTMDLRNKVCLVTGASSGIGLALARLFVQHDVKVALVARTASKLDAAVAELGADRAAAFPVDVTDRAAIDRLPRAVVEKFGRLDILVNNAGCNHRGAAKTRTAEEIVQVLETNLVSVAYLTRRALDVIPPGGAIINVASLAGKVPYGTQGAYCASKAGLRFFSLALREELSQENIRVLCVNPGPVDTEFFGDVVKAADLTFSQPMSTVEEVAAVTLDGLLRDLPEVDLPSLSGKLATLGYLSPGLKSVLRPLLERIGKKNKERYMRRRGMIP
jgi:short-subunit dehydrogenase